MEEICICNGHLIVSIKYVHVYKIQMILHYGMEEEEESLSKGKKGIEVVFSPLSFFFFPV